MSVSPRFAWKREKGVLLYFLTHTRADGTIPSEDSILSKEAHMGIREVTYTAIAVRIAAAFFLGGIIGLGTLVCALGLGPFIQFFNVHISRKLCGYEE